MSGRAKNNWIKKQKYKLLRIGLVEAGREARGEDEQVRDSVLFGHPPNPTPPPFHQPKPNSNPED